LHFIQMLRSGRSRFVGFLFLKISISTFRFNGTNRNFKAGQEKTVLYVIGNGEQTVSGLREAPSPGPPPLSFGRFERHQLQLPTYGFQRKSSLYV
jgi:hypothetical protein